MKKEFHKFRKVLILVILLLLSQSSYAKIVGIAGGDIEGYGKENSEIRDVAPGSFAGAIFIHDDNVVFYVQDKANHTDICKVNVTDFHLEGTKTIGGEKYIVFMGDVYNYNRHGNLIIYMIIPKDPQDK